MYSQEDEEKHILAAFAVPWKQSHDFGGRDAAQRAGRFLDIGAGDPAGVAARGIVMLDLAESTHGHHCTDCGGFYRCLDEECDGNTTGEEVCCDCGGMYG